MRYVCVEHDQVISMLNYEPQVPDHVHVYQISLQDYALILDQTHYFDCTTKQVQPVCDTHMSQRQMESQNQSHKQFLDQTDWQVLRHLRQLHLGISTSLTESEFTALEQARHAASQQIS